MHIYIHTPVHSHQISSIYWATMWGLKDACREAGHQLTVKATFGVSDLIKARNIGFHQFLCSGADRLITFDSDQGILPGDLLKLAEDPHNIVAAPVIKKNDSLPMADRWNFLVEPGQDVVQDKDCFRVWAVGAGCMAISRVAAMVMAKNAERFMVEGIPVPNVYRKRMITDDVLWPIEFSEDYSFCVMARELGLSVWVKAGLIVQHMGEKIFQERLYV